MTTDAELADDLARGLDGSDHISYMLRDTNWRKIIAALRRQSGEIDKIVEIVVQLEYDHWLRNGSAIKKQDAVLVSADVRRLLDEPQTPRTDAVAGDGWSDDAECVSADFARQLELELIGSRRIIDEMGVELRKAQEQCAELEKDAARYKFIRNLVAIEDIERLMADGNPTPDEQESLMTDAAIDTVIQNAQTRD